jgi:regulator of protease activity HflC (stomatin/prohibitin superfamily)
MSPRPSHAASVEREIQAFSGWAMLLFNLALLLGAALSFVLALIWAGDGHTSDSATAVRLVGSLLAQILAVFLLCGYYTLQPNEARVMILLGRYHGTVRRSGFHWSNPLYSRTRGGPRHGADAVEDASPRRLGALRAALRAAESAPSTKLSLRAHNFNSPTLKVNDKRGNPVEIAAVVVWRVEDTAQAVFDVEDYASYVQVQSESAIRSIASHYAYDFGEEHELTLRGGADEVAAALKDELQARLVKAGVTVEEARLTHLAYAPEIAPVMLRRQQAEATIAARKMIVQNAVSMVHMALHELADKGIVKLDDERQAAMVSNLLVVLCGTTEATPVINAGTLYS